MAGMVSPMARRFLVLFVLLFAVAACSDDGSPTVDGTTTSSTTSTTAKSTTSSTEPGGGTTTTEGPGVPTTTPSGPGLPLRGSTGSGTFTWSVDADTAEFCYRITIKDAGDATSARLLNGGDEVLRLVAPGVNGTVNTCSPTDTITAEQLQQNPGAFTLEVVADKGTLKGALQ
jgi:hypothetical protein